MKSAQWFAGICLMLGFSAAGFAAGTQAAPSANAQQTMTDGRAQTVEAGCDLPYVVREPTETVSSFKKRLRERQEAIESCQRQTAEQETAGRK